MRENFGADVRVLECKLRYLNSTSLSDTPAGIRPTQILEARRQNRCGNKVEFNFMYLLTMLRLSSLERVNDNEYCDQFLPSAYGPISVVNLARVGESTINYLLK